MDLVWIQQARFQPSRAQRYNLRSRLSFTSMDALINATEEWSSPDVHITLLVSLEELHVALDAGPELAAER